MQYAIEEIAHLVGASLNGANPTGATVSQLLTDSRSLSIPEETLFFAITTQRNDGHHYIQQLYDRGVRFFVISHSIEKFNCPEATFLKVSDTVQALQTLAAHHRSRFTIPVIAITGSNGKTIVKEWLYQLLSPYCRITRSPRSYNSQIGVPLSLWLLTPDTQVAIIEAGISRPGEMERLNRIIRPTIAVVTNIGEAHAENFQSSQQKKKEKLYLLEGADTSIVCRNLPDFHLGQVEKNENNAIVRFTYKNHNYSYKLPFIDDASIENSLTCLQTILTLPTLSEKLSDILQRMSLLETVAMRLEVKAGINGCTLINDTYNSDIHSLDIALDFMSRRPNNLHQNRTLILSDILQSGQTTPHLYRWVAQMLVRRGISRLIAVGPDIASCASVFPIETFFFPTTDSLLNSSLLTSLHNEFILIKGSRLFAFDRICDMLTERVHQTTLQVNLTALVDNLNHYRHFLLPSTKITCMVKADAYGIGAVEASRTLAQNGVDYLAVAVADEGVTLRRAGITANIMVMNPETTSFHHLFQHHLEPEVYSFELLTALIQAADSAGIQGHPIHIKFDTGMHRLGFNPETDMDRLIHLLQHQNALIPRSVFSHFVGSDDTQFDTFSHQQFQQFDHASRRLQSAFSHKILRHICNSAGIEHFPQYHLDMVRLGLGLYGINPIGNTPLATVATLRTTILQIREIPSGDSVGYSRRTHVSRPSRIAAIPIGYADGLNRRLGNRAAHCLVHGQPAPYLGNICMDVAMIDITDIPAASVGDTVTIFGSDLPVTQLSDTIGTIPYEILTGISPRVRRVYNVEV